MPASPGCNPFLSDGSRPFPGVAPLDIADSSSPSFETSSPSSAPWGARNPLVPKGGSRGRRGLLAPLLGVAAPLLSGCIAGLSVGTLIGAFLPSILLSLTGHDLLPTIIHKGALFLLCWLAGPLLLGGGCACAAWRRQRRTSVSCATRRCTATLFLVAGASVALCALALVIPSAAHDSFLLVAGSWFATWPADGYCAAAANASAVRAAASAPWWHRWGSEPASAAAALAAAMSEEERALMLNGEGYGLFGQLPGAYVGGLPATPRLLIPSIHLQDAAQGFRTSTNAIIGQVTSFPSLLALGATWDASLATSLGLALGDEFRAKGANVILGPSVNVHRMPRNGRNVEYVSGEEPLLGAVLGAAYVRGVQSRGVAANVKHFVLNHQETDRMTTSADVSDRVLFEVYYPPFEAAVEAGVASLMCSYNKINGTHACGNAHVLGQLRTDLGFRGWVVSDWWAVHDFTRSVDAGLDVAMPGNDGYYSPSRLRRMPRSHAREIAMVKHVLYGMLSAGALDESQCTAGCDCEPFLYGVNASTPEHITLARTIAAQSVILLKNERSVLPLPRGARVAMAGSACGAGHSIDVEADDWKAGDYYVVGGSGRVVSNRAVSITAALTAAGVQTTTSDTDDLADALAIATPATADYLLVCAGGVTFEDADRPTLKVDQHDLLVGLAAAASSGALHVPLVVALMAPGQLAVAPWVDGADAVAAMFLGGQETGNGWADVLLGEVNPSGKLPVTFVRDEKDYKPPGPCVGEASDHCVYSEGLNVAWRGMIGSEAVAFSFGHGLSYTSFSYAWLATPVLAPDGSVSLSVLVNNTGAVAGAEVAQLYLRYPQSAGEPDLVLRGFEKTPVLPPAATHRITFTLSPRDLSVWTATPHSGAQGDGDAAAGDSAPAGSWVRASGSFTMIVGSGSRDQRLEAELAV